MLNLKSKEILYDLLRDKTESQVFYNEMMVRMINPLARKLFKTFRDGDESDLLNVRKCFLGLEAKPMMLKTFYNAGKPSLKRS